ncbi:hypothetical protein [Roseobacter sp. HKCCA0434]|uniref:hypothetical protein n=1 Tax=Roseobacter sp. HKCCA0434 TaxID=3079297 RepID=UPI0029057F93|nr:hypothetical protein [Roseobacter sp. HKCCA0434]
MAKAQTQPAPEIERSYAVALIRDTMALVNHGNWTGNYTVLRDAAADAFADANDPTRLAAMFVQLRAERLDLLQTMVVDPVILNIEAADGTQALRLTGYFPLQPRHVSFDLTFARDLSRYRLTGLSVGAFEPL